MGDIGQQSSDQQEINITWKGKTYPIHVSPEDTVQVIKRKLEIHTTVQTKRQKLLVKSTSGPLTDDTRISTLIIKPKQKIVMLGAPEEDITSLQQAAEVAPEIQDDLDFVEEIDLPLDQQPIIQERLQRRIASVEPKILNPPRPGKKLLILDIDYTIFDLGSAAERPEELARPHLHEFMSTVYQHYDLAIWSATSMKWVEVKMKELGVTTHPDYKITFMLDHKAMLTVNHPKYGVFDCKPLDFIWAKWEGYHKGNTIMFDDLKRNFVLNKENGLVIVPYRKSHRNREVDRELMYLKRYLMLIVERGVEDMSVLRHKHWKRYLLEWNEKN
jgi:ubiquitin-like domain-containing CTD phosphatase 1